MDINFLKQMRGKSDFSEMVKELEKTNSNSNNQSFKDERFWKPERDKAGNGSAVIRFLPKHPNDKAPWVKVFSYSFQGPTGKWYIEDSLQNIGQDDPVSDLNRQLYADSKDENHPSIKQAKRQSRKTHYISNVLIISDPKHPENNGTVKLFKYGKKIFDKINEAMRPTFEDEQPVYVFDVDEGANFKLRIKTVDEYPNYDSSSFDGTSPITDNDDELYKILSQVIELNEFVDPKKYKSYEELSKKLDLVLNGKPGVKTKAETDTVDFESAPVPKMKEVEAKSEPVASMSLSDDDDDFDMSFFEKQLNK